MNDLFTTKVSSMNNSDFATQTTALLAQNQRTVTQVSDTLAAPHDRAVVGDATKKQMGGAAIVGGVLGLLVVPFHGIFLALVLAAVSAGACANDGKIGEIARQTGDVTMDAVAKSAVKCNECVSKDD